RKKKTKRAEFLARNPALNFYAQKSFRGQQYKKESSNIDIIVRLFQVCHFYYINLAQMLISSPIC
ncbi:hypothetical protein, partial [Prevotella corporis]|uniref:hypothetical protein n=1 Tax=Prevotella corporis TaxID=28128 RepID=UPI00056A8D70